MLGRFMQLWQRYRLRVRFLPLTEKLLFTLFKLLPAAYPYYSRCCAWRRGRAASRRGSSFHRAPTISIITPLYNTPRPFLTAMIESVLSQTYGGWELCLADGSDAAHGDVYETAAAYARRDDRIRLCRLGMNGGISANSRAALAMATGEYIALLDHDDLLAPHALYEILCALNEGTEPPDFLYTDEDKIDWSGRRLFGPVFKPDFSAAALEANNYICHLAVMSHTLLQSAGAFFDSRYDGAQDYDLFLRCAERAAHICHVPYILYHWRVHEKSTAAGGRAKPYTQEAGRHALQAHFARIGRDVTVIDDPSGAPNCYCTMPGAARQ